VYKVSNEQLAQLAADGDPAAVLALWGQIYRFVFRQARRWYMGSKGRGGVEVEDLEQVGFLALVDAVQTFDARRGTKFLTHYGFYLKSAFTAATGQRTERDRLDPIESSLSLDAPLMDNAGELFDLMDVLPDQAASADLDGVDSGDQWRQLHAALRAAVEGLPPDQRAAIHEKFFVDNGHPDRVALRKGLQTLRHPRISRELLQLWHGD
jgi:DNA-directed RNA polymerase specialized sigma24 family protein